MSIHFDEDLFLTLVDQVESASTTGGGLSNISKWIETNTSDPVDPNKRFSFKGHEYQREILDDNHPVVSIKKSTQCGLSELSIRQALAILAKYRGIHGIYVMPTAHGAQKIASTRIDPIIEASPRLRNLVAKDVDSTMLKRIGRSFLHLLSGSATSSAISTPARMLMLDEMEFLDPEVVNIFASRLGHQKEEDRIVRYFSSPLFPGSGITKLFEDGTRNHYMIWHTVCGRWVLPDLLQHLILPGFDENITLLSPSDLTNPNYRIDEAYILCPECRRPITVENMAEPTYRAWVAEYPDRRDASYNANALVLPQIRNPPRLIRDLGTYKDNVTWQRFGLGCAAEGAGEMILRSVIENSFTVRPQGPLSGAVTGAVLGMDVGRTSHLAIGKKNGKLLEIVHLEKIVQDGSNNTKNVFVERYTQYRAVQGIIDAAPDLTIPKSIQEETPYNNVWACFYVRGQGRSSLTPYTLDEAEGVIKANRTKTIDEYVSDWNRGYIKLPMGLQFEDEVKSHLEQLKRVVNIDGVGEEKAQWITSSDDNHFFFAIYYAWLAAKLCDDNLKIFVQPASSLLVSKVKMRSVAA